MQYWRVGSVKWACFSRFQLGYATSQWTILLRAGYVTKHHDAGLMTLFRWAQSRCTSVSATSAYITQKSPMSTNLATNSTSGVVPIQWATSSLSMGKVEHLMHVVSAIAWHVKHYRSKPSSSSSSPSPTCVFYFGVLKEEAVLNIGLFVMGWCRVIGIKLIRSWCNNRSYTYWDADIHRWLKDIRQQRHYIITTPTYIWELSSEPKVWTQCNYQCKAFVCCVCGGKGARHATSI